MWSICFSWWIILVHCTAQQYTVDTIFTPVALSVGFDEYKITCGHSDSARQIFTTHCKTQTSKQNTPLCPICWFSLHSQDFAPAALPTRVVCSGKPTLVISSHPELRYLLAQRCLPRTPTLLLPNHSLLPHRSCNSSLTTYLALLFIIFPFPIRVEITSASPTKV